MSKLGEAILKKLPSALAYDNLISIDMVKRRLELREILKKYPDARSVSATKSMTRALSKFQLKPFSSGTPMR